MRNYYQSTVDFSEIRHVIDPTINNDAIDELKDLGILNSKGKPDIQAIKGAIDHNMPYFLSKLERVMRRRGGLEPVQEIFLRLYNSKEYYGFFLMLAIEYGMIGWQTPRVIVMLPACIDALKLFEAEFLVALADYITTLNEFVSGLEQGVGEENTEESGDTSSQNTETAGTESGPGDNET